jgi:hypothetical protein
MARLQLLLLLPLALPGEGRHYLLETADSPTQANSTEADSPASLFSDYWAWRLRRSPEFATMTGDRGHNTRLETFTQVDNTRCGGMLSCLISAAIL